MRTPQATDPVQSLIAIKAFLSETRSKKRPHKVQRCNHDGLRRAEFKKLAWVYRVASESTFVEMARQRKSNTQC